MTGRAWYWAASTTPENIGDGWESAWRFPIRKGRSPLIEPGISMIQAFAGEAGALGLSQLRYSAPGS
ncbi:hypothetical protein J2X42_002513 [Arthrobacter sp. BE255]|nr:hypothetical protein [Arthrobacter sp. BE255]